MLSPARIKTWALRIAGVVLLAGALAATFGGFAVASLQIALRTRETPVPGVAGLTPEEAERVLADAGLSLAIEPSRRVNATIAAGRIAEQNPSAGVPTRRRRSVTVWLSSGETPATVPMLVGASERAARRRLEDSGFTVGGLSEIRSRQFAVDAVVAQHQAPDDPQAVLLLVNRGERGQTYVMPDVIGVEAEVASEVLRTRGFRTTVVGSHLYPGIPPGVVLRQAPPPGFQIAPGEPISLEVSQ